MEFDKDYISCEPSHIGMVKRPESDLKGLERSVAKFDMHEMAALLFNEAFAVGSRKNPYKKPFRKMDLRAITADEFV